MEKGVVGPAQNKSKLNCRAISNYLRRIQKGKVVGHDNITDIASDIMCKMIDTEY